MEKVETIFTIGDQRSGIIETTNFRHVSNIFCRNVDFYVSMILGMPQTYSNYQMIYNYYGLQICIYEIILHATIFFLSKSKYRPFTKILGFSSIAGRLLS